MTPTEAAARASAARHRVPNRDVVVQVLADVRAAVVAGELLEARLADAVAAARASGAPSRQIARAAGMHHATLYRRFPVEGERPSLYAWRTLAPERREADDVST